MNLGNQKKNKQMKFYHSIQIIHPYIKVIKNLVEVLKRNNVSGFKIIKLINNKRQPPNLKKRNSAMKKYVLESAKIHDANVASHSYYPKNIHLKMLIKHLH